MKNIDTEQEPQGAAARHERRNFEALGSPRGYVRHLPESGYGEYVDSITQAQWEGWLSRAALAAPAAQVAKEWTEAELDDDAVYQFSRMMKEKMASARAKGRGGWMDPKQCSVESLQRMFHEHVAKGDPVDVANFCMMLRHYGASTSPALPAAGGDARLGMSVLRDSLLSAREAFAKMLDYVDNSTPHKICTKQMQSIDSDLAKTTQIAAAQRRAEQGDAEIPDHPDPMSMKWTQLEEAAKVCDTLEDFEEFGE